MLQIFKGNRTGIVEYLLGLFERDSMLLHILLGFNFVPFEMHQSEYIHIEYIFKNRERPGAIILYRPDV